KGKDEPLDLYAVGWSESATQRLIEEAHARFETKITELQRQQSRLEEDFENARARWRADRRSLHAEIERLEHALAEAAQNARRAISDEIHSELRFHVEQAVQARQQIELEFADARKTFESERDCLKKQISEMQDTVVDAMERVNNPARLAMLIRD